MSGYNFPLDDNTKILGITSPKNNVKGPYVVVYKHLEERWAIVAMDWDGKPRIGIRWFWGNGGNPFSSGKPIWLVVPPSLSKGILAGLPLDHTFSRKLDDFLAGKIIGTDLKQLEPLDDNAVV